MRSSTRLLAVLSFAAVSLLALLCSGLLDWVASSLFLVLEFLAEFVRRVFVSRRPTHGPSPVARHRSAAVVHRVRRPGLKKNPAARKRPGLLRDDPAAVPLPTPSPRIRILLPLSADQPEIVAFALGECRARNAELLVLFLRPLAVTPMGPNPTPAADEDAEARAVLTRVSARAAEAGVPVRAFYRATNDRTAAVIGVAKDHDADVLLMEATRRHRFWNPLAVDLTRAVLAHLPSHVSLIVHAA